MTLEWFYKVDDAQRGPLTAAELSELAASGNLTPASPVRRSDMQAWVPASRVKGLKFGATSEEVLYVATTDAGQRFELINNGRWREAADVSVPPPSSPDTVGENADFRKASWGMSRNGVKQTEPKSPTSECAEHLHYDGSIAELDCIIAYLFAKDMFVRSKYFITEKHSNDNKYILDYEDLKSLLATKYGDPKHRIGGDMCWSGDLYKDDPDEWGMAVSYGQLSYMSQWTTDRTDISLLLCGDNYEIQLSIEYVSKQLGSLEQEQNRQQIIDLL